MTLSNQMIQRCRIADRYRFQRLRSRAKTEAQRKDLATKIARSIQQVEARAKAAPRITYPPQLPISDRAEEIIKLVEHHQVVIVAGETGSGKSTQLPKICLDAGRGICGQIAHTQPRRIATRAIANRLAKELGVDLSKGVGYRVRFDESVSAQDYIRVLTDGMLLAEAQTDRFLNQYDTIIIDEAHERSLNIDFLLGYLKRLLPKRKDLKLIITSATIDTDKFSQHFDSAPIISVSGRTYPVEIRYQPSEDDKTRSDDRVNQAIHGAIESLFKARPGHTLVFLPGEREIHEAQRYLLRRLKPGIEVLPLYARLAAKAQSALFQPAHKTRIILSTNVAETSLTLPGIDYVIDSGLARVSRYNPGRRINTLPIERISKAAADQRKGRCGRVANGICVRLYSEEDFTGRADYTAPEVLRTALTGVVLSLTSRHLGEPENFPFVDPPERKQWSAARQELKILSVLDEQDNLTQIGRMLSKLPVDPRIGRMLYAAAKAESCLSEMIILAASLELQDPRLVPHDKLQAARMHHRDQAKDKCDFFALLDLYQAFEFQRNSLSRSQLNGWCARNFLAPSRMREWQDLVRRLTDDTGIFNAQTNMQPASTDAVHRALFSGLIDQLALKAEKGLYTGAFGKQMAIFPGSSLSKTLPKWIMAAELVETSQLFARSVAPIKVEWIEEFAGPLMRHEYSEPHWSLKSGQVMAYQRGYFLNLPVFSGRRKPYYKIDPVESRTLFIRDGLVPGELGQPPDFVEHNLSLVDEIITLEHKIRRHDILVSEQTLANFYAARLPEGVFSEITLRKWLKSINTEQCAQLKLTRADLLTRELSDHEQDLPDELLLCEHRLDLEYHFAPGEETDGISAQIPLPLLNQLSQADFDKLVPAYLPEKIEYLIRSLPKMARIQLAPLSSTIPGILIALKKEKLALLPALARIINSRTSLNLTAADFRLGNLPKHLNMNLVVVDKSGSELGRSDQLKTLQHAFGKQARKTIATLESEWQQTGLTSWCFPSMPDSIEIDAHGHQTKAYPALVDAGKHVDLQLFDQAETAVRAHLSGATRLIRVGTPFGQKLLKRPLPYWQEISLHYAAVGAQQALRDALLDAVIISLIPDQARAIRNETEFNICTDTIEYQFSHAIEPACQSLQQALKAYTSSRRALSEKTIPIEIKNDIQSQLDYLVYENFLIEVSLDELNHYPIYFRALAARIERLPYDMHGDLRKLSLLTPYWNRYRSNWEAHPFNAELEYFRWLVEAYRVSLFAPKVKPPSPISPTRLDRAWEAYQISIKPDQA